MTSKLSQNAVKMVWCLNVILSTTFPDKYRSIKKHVFSSAKKYFTVFALVNKSMTSMLYTRPVISTP